PRLVPICAAAALRRWRRYTLLAWAAAPAVGAAAFGRHLMGWRRRFARALPMLTAALASGSPGRGAAPCGLAATVRACGAVATAGGCPFTGGPWL
ncbi:hypothetical protein GW17_00013951, partial [Ensete ventricosum]